MFLITCRTGMYHIIFYVGENSNNYNLSNYQFTGLIGVHHMVCYENHDSNFYIYLIAATKKKKNKTK